MKKQILNLGKPLGQSDQKLINGGASTSCYQKGPRCCEQRSWGEFCDAGRCGTFGCFWY